MTLINIGGDTRTQEDKIAQRIRKRMIESGCLIPGRPSALRPYMHADAVLRTKAFLTRQGIITPEGMKPPVTTAQLIAQRTKRMCPKCRNNHWLCPCGVLE